MEGVHIFNNGSSTYPLQSSNLIFPTPCQTRIKHLAQIDNHVKAIMGLSRWKTYDNPTTSKIAIDDIKVAFLAKEWNSSYLSRKKLEYLHLEEFLKYERELYLKLPLTQDRCCQLHLKS